MCQIKDKELIKSGKSGVTEATGPQVPNIEVVGNVQHAMLLLSLPLRPPSRPKSAQEMPE